MKEKERFIVLRSSPVKPVLTRSYSFGSFGNFARNTEDSKIKIEIEELGV